MSESQSKLFVGVDWSTSDQVVAIHDDTGEVVGESSFALSGEGIALFCADLDRHADGRRDRVHVAIETPHGAVVDTLLEKGFRVYAINPKQLDRFRDRFTAAGAKDDRRDACVLASSLRTDSRAFRQLTPEAPETLRLREWSRMAEGLKRERVALSNQLREQIRRYYPQLLEVTPEIWKDWFLQLWEAAPTPAKARRVRQSRIAKILADARIRVLNAKEVLEILRQTPVFVAPGVEEAASDHIRLVAERIKVVNSQIKEAERMLDTICREIAATQPSDPEKGGRHDVEILRSLPGVGRIVLAVLLAEAPRAIDARDYQLLRRLSGVAPVTAQSGKLSLVSMRRACHYRLRDSLYHMARTSIQVDDRCREQYARLRAKGHRHGRALRGIADSLLRVLCAMLRDGATYDPSRRGRSQRATA